MNWLISDLVQKGVNNSFVNFQNLKRSFRQSRGIVISLVVTYPKVIVVYWPASEGSLNSEGPWDGWTFCFVIASYAFSSTRFKIAIEKQFSRQWDEKWIGIKFVSRSTTTIMIVPEHVFWLEIISITFQIQNTVNGIQLLLWPRSL